MPLLFVYGIPQGWSGMGLLDVINDINGLSKDMPCIAHAWKRHSPGCICNHMSRPLWYNVCRCLGPFLSAGVTSIGLSLCRILNGIFFVILADVNMERNQHHIEKMVLSYKPGWGCVSLLHNASNHKVPPEHFYFIFFSVCIFCIDSYATAWQNETELDWNRPGVRLKYMVIACSWGHHFPCEGKTYM